VPAVNSALVVGAGLAGAGVAIHLASQGVAVDLVEIKPEITALGSGITLQGNALRELRSLGVWEQVHAAGYAFDVTGIRAPDPNGTVVAEIPDAKTGGPDLPAVMGMPMTAAVTTAAMSNLVAICPPASWKCTVAGAIVRPRRCVATSRARLPDRAMALARWSNGQRRRRHPR